MSRPPLKVLLEGALLAAAEPVSIERLLAMFEGDPEGSPDRAEVAAALDALVDDYAGRALELRTVASGLRFQVRSELAPWINRLWGERPTRYSRALLETLAVIAYRQPVTRGEIEDIRGVTVSTSIMKTLSDREWIRVAGYRDVPGRPAVYATTRQFLDYFNLRSLADLPTLAELRDIDTLTPDLFESAPQPLETEGSGADRDAAG